MRSAFGIVHKSYVGGGVFKPVTALSGAERKAVRGGGLYSAAKGVTKPDKKYSKFYHQNVIPATKHSKGDLNGVGLVPVPKTALAIGGASAATFRAGGKNTGKSFILKPKKMSNDGRIMSHEMQHAKPRRTAYRMEQISSDPEKRMREESRADYLSSGHFAENPRSGYAEAAAHRESALANPTKKNLRRSKESTGDLADNFRMKNKDMRRSVDAYRNLHNTLRAKGVQEGPFAGRRKK